MGVEVLLGKVLKGIKNSNVKIEFETVDGERYQMYHNQDCCESVYVEDIVGDLQDLIGSPITLAEESTNSNNPKDSCDSHTWTFYRLATFKGYVTIRWYGSSNGYYSESVTFEKI